MKTVAVMPMKLNNRRLPQKNTKCFVQGKPLCSYALTTLASVSGIDDIYVYCSDEAILDFIPNGISYLKRNEMLDGDEVSMNEVLKRFAFEIDADIYVLVHATSPFISCGSIEKGIRAVKSEGYDSAFSVMALQDFLWVEGKPFNYKLENIPRTQDLPIMYKETSGFYVFERDVLVKQGKRIGTNPYMVEVGKIEGIDIDEEEDFIIANAINYYMDGRGL